MKAAPGRVSAFVPKAEVMDVYYAVSGIANLVNGEDAEKEYVLELHNEINKAASVRFLRRVLVGIGLALIPAAFNTDVQDTLEDMPEVVSVIAVIDVTQAWDLITFSQHNHLAIMFKAVFLSVESLNEGHPDTLCDQVSDAVLDAGVTATKEMVIVAQTKANYEKVVCGVVVFDSYVDEFSSAVSDKTCEVIVCINKQSPDIASGVHASKEDLDIGAGAVFWYAEDILGVLTFQTASNFTHLIHTMNVVCAVSSLSCASVVESQCTQGQCSTNEV